MSHFFSQLYTLEIGNQEMEIWKSKSWKTLEIEILSFDLLDFEQFFQLNKRMTAYLFCSIDRHEDIFLVFKLTARH